MKKVSLIFTLVLFLPYIALSQSPQGINYQGVARNNVGKPLVNQILGIKISVYDSINFRSDLYSETHSATTNSQGIYNLIIGKGNVISGIFDSIKWANTNKWIEVKIDPNGGSNYILSGSQQLMSVPYALYTGNHFKGQDLQVLTIKNDSIFLNKNGGQIGLKKYWDNTDSQKLIKLNNSISISNGNTISLNDDDSTNELQTLSISNDTIKLSKSNTIVKLPNAMNDMEDALGCVFVHRFCSGDGSFNNPWKSSDGSAGIFDAIKNLTITKRIVYFKPGYYHTKGALDVDFSKLLSNLSDPIWKTTFAGYGIEFQGHNASIYVNGGAPLTGGKPGILFNWKGEHAFYWKFTGLQFYGVVDTALVQFGNSYEFPWNGCDFDITGNNGYVYPNYANKESPSSAIKICWPLECRIHAVAVSATGSGLVLETATFCTINGAFSNTLIPNTNTIYGNSYGLNLINCQSNTFTHMDLEVAYNGIKFDQWTITNTFSAIFVSYCDTTGATFDNSKQVTNGKNIVLSIRSGGTAQVPSTAYSQKLFTSNSDKDKLKIENYFGF